MFLSFCSMLLSFFNSILFSHCYVTCVWMEWYIMNKHVNKVLQQRIKHNKNMSVAESQWSCQTLLQPDLWHKAEPHIHTDPRITLFKQHLSFLRLILALFLQEEGINKPIRIQIIKHYLDPLPVSCVCWQRLQITKFVYYFAWLLTVWFSCV